VHDDRRADHQRDEVEGARRAVHAGLHDEEDRGQGDHGPQDQTAHDLQAEGGRRRLTRTADREQHDDHRQGEAVVQAALDVQEVPEAPRHLGTAHDRRCEHGVGGAEGGGDDEGQEPRQADDDVAEEGEEQERRREPEQQGPPREAPRRSEVGEPQRCAIGEQDGEQGDARQLRT